MPQVRYIVILTFLFFLTSLCGSKTCTPVYPCPGVHACTIFSLYCVYLLYTYVRVYLYSL
ncbi:hypothetical protein BCR43DRAFT_55599 [Syncephalastrum racemosum]|uniref:Uncharacterized protein n=1 Tax=Syncephalastrum racemosum TaxID=13706 RepID=A0A1X2HVI3_SYNRA|nr:hypothetical protein BCR43DRAFT_55599 [Syncephalastrum racemosum]